ncbi:DUF1294 domain-containing protein [Pelosinus sp. IPA-1]|uniref:DUF1294 domain-containing protein n=1 Tax=Pelosinus sp. IPA-1 TaxID=3029569 RepID=UPI0025523BFB|nr:DUF1294 domain-containing protein [Pelosinus sp. IPA-1]
MHLFLNSRIWLFTYVFWNIVTFFLIMLDKKRARQQYWRIRERTLFLCALFFGATGILIGMYMFRHKTRHWSFIIGIPFLLIINATCCYFIYRWGGALSQ